jgi:hypothetical protein
VSTARYVHYGRRHAARTVERTLVNVGQLIGGRPISWPEKCERDVFPDAISAHSKVSVLLTTLLPSTAV